MPKSQVLKATTFGDFFRTKRISLGLTLREFCRRHNYDPGNISKLERDILPPSIEKQKLEGYAFALKVPHNSAEWALFFDLAHAAKGTLPPDIKSDPRIISQLPAFYRTMRGRKLNKKKIQKLINLLYHDHENGQA